MRDFLKQLLVKDSDLNRRMGEAVRAACLRDSTILLCSIVVLALEAFALCALHFGFSRDVWLAPFGYSVIFALAFAALGTMDIVKRGCTSRRLFSVFCSVVALTLAAVVIYSWIHHFMSPNTSLEPTATAPTVSTTPVRL